MSPQTEPTIAAIATPPGAGGIGIIRLSGPDSLAILQHIFSPRATPCPFHSHRLYYGWIISPESGKRLDEVLAVYMKAPHTYTREDVVEIHCHGSFILLQRILTLVQEQGARPAAPGEFTKLAFLNGRIDLTRAEAVIELLQARTGEGVDIAANQLQGRLHESVEEIRRQLAEIKGIVEVAIDFPEDDVEILDSEALTSRLEEAIIPPLENLISAADNGKIFRKGVSVVIAGRPNVGKSSLLNALLREERAIVTPVPGTTRDTIEEYINIKGVPVRIIDTAGIRSGAESVEEIGIRRSREKLAEADLALLVTDASAPLEEEDHRLLAGMGRTPLIVVANKQDIVTPDGAADYTDAFGSQTIVRLSARELTGIEELEQAIFDAAAGGDGNWDPGDGAVPNVRHRAAMVKAVESCRLVIDGLMTASPDLIAIDLQAALDHLGEIVGYTTTEDILDTIFDNFCIGK